MSIHQEVVTKNDFFEQFSKYSNSQRLVLEDGRIVPWIDEDMNPYTGDWISRTRLKRKWSKKKGGVERGKDYNHSSYCDIFISDLIGLKPQLDNSIEIKPLIPDNTWDWFCLDGIAYKGNTLTILYDANGTKYNKGAGLSVFVNGVLKAQKDNIEKINFKLE